MWETLFTVALGNADVREAVAALLSSLPFEDIERLSPDDDRAFQFGRIHSSCGMKDVTLIAWACIIVEPPTCQIQDGTDVNSNHHRDDDEAESGGDPLLALGIYPCVFQEKVLK